MKIAIASDHGGYLLKEEVRQQLEKEGLDIVGKRRPKIINLRSNMFLQKLYFYVRNKNINYAINQAQLLNFMKKHFKAEITPELLLKMHGILIYEMGDLCKFVNDKYQMLSLDEIRIAYISNQIDKDKFKLYKKITKIERKKND